MEKPKNTEGVVLSLFSGAGLLDLGFEMNGFCVVSAGDIVLGQHHDIRRKHFPKGVFSGVIGGPPCVEFSLANRNRDPKKGMEMINEFLRVVSETSPDWFLMENVAQVPDVVCDNYHIQRIRLNALECGSSQNRNRHFQFGSKRGLLLNIPRDPSPLFSSRCVTASEGKQADRRTFADVCELQGLPRETTFKYLTQTGSYYVVGNGVNVRVASRIAAAISATLSDANPKTVHNSRICSCGCGKILTGSKEKFYFSATCRKVAERKRKRANTEGS